MKRAPLVAAATITGLVGVLSFHTQAAPLTLGITRGSAAGPTTAPSTTTTAGSAPKSGSSSSPTTTSPSGTPTTSPTTSTTKAPASSTTTVPSRTRRATGAAFNYNYGILSVSVTATGTKITNVQIATIDDGGNFRSQSIDQQSIPILEQQALQAQSANIQGVSGASYTSAGFAQSLQSALSKLGI